MSFWKKVLKIAKTVAPIAIGAFNPALGAAVGAGLGASGGGGIVGGLTGAAGGYFGGSALSGAASGFAGLPAAGAIGPTAGGLSGALSGGLAGISNAGSVLGGALGLSSGTVGTAAKALSAAQLLMPQRQQIAQQNIQGAAVPQATAPAPLSRPEEVSRPNSLSDLASFAPEQERAALATKGINTGLGQDENSYYRNLLQRSLIGDGNKIQTNNPNFLLPIESQYFSGQGKNTSDIINFLQGIR